MPFVRPTLSALVTRIRADFRSRLSISGSLLRRAMADVLAVVWAGAVHMTHGHLEWLGRQLIALYAEREFLIDIGSMYGISPTAATFATGTLTATGVDTTVIPTDTIYVRDDGVTYKVLSDATIAGGTATVSVQAVAAGAAGNIAYDASETLDLETPIAGVDTSASLDSPGISGGNDEEGTEALRARVLLRLREPPQGGASQDYEAWALAVAGVTRAWVYENENGLGTVVVRFVRDDDTPSIFPDAGEVTTVQTALDAERPITADVTAAAPVESAVAFTIAVTPDTTAVRDAIEAELEDLMLREAEPGDGAGRGEIKLSQIRTAIGIAAGLTDYTLTVPAADVTPATGDLLTVGTITWA